MNLISLIIALGIVGAIWYLVTEYIPLPAPIKTTITVVAVLALCVVLLEATGLGNIRIGN